MVRCWVLALVVVVVSLASESRISVKLPEATFDGCLTFAKSEEYLDLVAANYPEITKKRTIGWTVESRPMTGLCVGVCDSSVGVPETFLNGMHHSREGVSFMSLLYTLDRILEGYSRKDETTLLLLKTRRLWFLPIVNPDGYVYNEKKHPTGGGMQRKNRNQQGCSTSSRLGVDLNRNYDVCFDLTDDGASTNPCQEDYKGPSPFSEPETKAMKKFIEESNFTTALNMHSYGKLLLIPYSCQSMHYPDPVDNAYYLKYAKDLSTVNHFQIGRPYEPAINMYSVNGDAADWMFSKHRIFAASPEVGGGGFWPDKTKVVALSKINIEMILHAAWAAGATLRVAEIDAKKAKGKLVLEFNVLNIGLWHTNGTVTVAAVGDTGARTFADAGVILAKYGESSKVKMTVTVPKTQIQIVVYDSSYCIVYTIASGMLNGGHSILLDDMKHGKRVQVNSELCKLEIPDTKHPTKNITENTTGVQPFGVQPWTDRVYHEPIVASILILGLFCMCGCCIVGRSRSQQYEQLEAKGGQ
eukprot:CAMPEP_0203749396 /NCGR_PEP_ID=MMETSP0098-20131031/3984_1 /ASSEMBLY_ACC=CAM_ASM_000208 /TAXON_ID=96639 /ORGANISM=" , Strain NY0313808BC1" /LENGTH=526 /DNA_ID=CAMNT_0050638451 /DNA_START=794 /DNA_END=2371 /DNA_ORIENTATION=-